MPRTFNDPAFEQLTWDAHHLFERAVHHEHDLVSLVSMLDAAVSGATPAMPGLDHPPGAVAAALAQAGSSPTVVDLLPRIRHLCVAAREHRQLAEELTGKLTGEPTSAGSAHHGRQKVLVVDDAEDTRDLVAVTLTASGFQTITAANGLEALIKAHTERPAVILMDVNMPVLNGIEAARLLKAGADTRHMHVIAHTAKAEFLDGPMRRLFAYVVRKPAPPNELVASVKAFLAEARQQGPGLSDIQA